MTRPTAESEPLVPPTVEIHRALCAASRGLDYASVRDLSIALLCAKLVSMVDLLEDTVRKEIAVRTGA